MKVAVVICTLNAVRGNNDWEAALRQIADQSLQADLYLIVDSQSDDETIETARRHKWTVQSVMRRSFNHGKTRNDILHFLQQQAFDIVIFISQDVVLDNRGSLWEMIDFLNTNHLAAAYGRQITMTERGFDTWQRRRCYPESSEIKSWQNVSEKGLMTAFCSNAFCAWDINKALENGGFPDTDFGEDMLLAAKSLLAGDKIGYCARAVCRHEHSQDLPALFKRGVAIGKFHAQNRWLKERFGGIERTAMQKWTMNSAILQIIPGLLIKYIGYQCGKISTPLFPVTAFVLIWLCLSPLIFFNDIPSSDVSSRYAPMADFFAKGNWEFAFHPRIAPLFPVISGVVCYLFGLNGFAGCKIASALMLSLSIFPLWGMLCVLFNKTIARIGIILFVFCSHLLRMGYSGLRESTSCFCLLLCAYLLVVISETRKPWKLYSFAGVAIGLLLLSRSDMLLIGGLLGLIILEFDIIGNKFPVRSMITAGVLLMVISPFLAYNYFQVGYLVLDVRYAAIMRSIEEHYDINLFHNPSPEMTLDIRAISLEKIDDE